MYLRLTTLFRDAGYVAVYKNFRVIWSNGQGCQWTLLNWSCDRRIFNEFVMAGDVRKFRKFYLFHVWIFISISLNFPKM